MINDQCSCQILEIVVDQSGQPFIIINDEVLCPVDYEVRLKLINLLTNAILMDEDEYDGLEGQVQCAIAMLSMLS